METMFQITLVGMVLFLFVCWWLVFHNTKLKQENASLYADREAADIENRRRFADLTDSHYRELIQRRHESTNRCYVGPFVVCDRRATGTIFKVPGITERDPTRHIHNLFEEDYPIKPAAEFRWSKEEGAWSLLSDNKLGTLLKVLSSEYHHVLFIHVVRSDSICKEQCQQSLDWQTCDCSCAGERHGAGTGNVWSSWTNLGSRQLPNDWIEKYFLIEKDWHFVE